jgi:hypothetical protein
MYLLLKLLFFCGETQNLAHLKGWAMKILDFFGPKMALAIARAI